MMKRNRTLWIASLFLVLGLLVGYHPWIVGNDHSESSSVVEGAQRIVIDDWGRSISVPVEAKRIVSLTSAYEPILLDMVGPNRLGAVSFI